MNKFYKIIFTTLSFVLIVNSISYAQCNASAIASFNLTSGPDVDGNCIFTIEWEINRGSGNHAYALVLNGSEVAGGVLRPSNTQDNGIISLTGSCNSGDYNLIIQQWNDPNRNSLCSPFETPVNISGALPVEFLYFKAQPDSKFIKLEWATASEINNAFFSVEYSRNGIGYKEIGRTAGNGNSVETIEYEFMHDAPLIGENYYRLRQEDFDGTFEYSDVVVVDKDGDQAVSIRPNTVQEEMTVVVSKGFEKDTDGIVYDLLGSEVMTVRFPAQAAQQTFDVSHLPSGHYFFRVQEGASLVTARFVKTD